MLVARGSFDWGRAWLRFGAELKGCSGVQPMLGVVLKTAGRWGGTAEGGAGLGFHYLQILLDG